MRRTFVRFGLVVALVTVVVASFVPQASSGALRGGSDKADSDQAPVGRSISPAKYLAMREHQVNLYRGAPFNLPYNARERALRQFDREVAAEGPRAASSVWTPIGPAPIPNGQVAGGATNIPVSGRVTAIAIKPTNASILYVGTAQGGLYRSLDGGTTWTPLMDDADSLAIGAVAIDPSATTTVWVGTGEGNLSGDSYAGVGLYRITNAESNTPTVSGPFDTRVAGTGTLVGNGHAFFGASITGIAVDPASSDRVYVATTLGGIGVGDDLLCCGVTPNGAAVGLYRTTNGTNATPTFSLVAGGFPANGTTAATDVMFVPGASETLVASAEDLTFATTASNGVYRSTNADNTTPSFTHESTPLAPFNLRFAANSLTVLAGAETASGGRLFESTDGGATWPTTVMAANNFCDGQCFYDIGVAIDPSNSSKIYLGGNADPNSPTGPFPTQFALSTNGTSFTRSDTNLHADTHSIAIAPSNTATIYTGDDGGIFKSTNSGGAWTSLNNSTFSATQFESLAVHPTDPNFTIGGTQDNGTEFHRPNGTWTRADFGDGGFSAIDQNAADTTNVTMYHTYFNQKNNLIGFARVTTTANAHDNGWTFLGCSGNASHNGIGCSNTVLFYAPLALGPGTPNRVYFGTDRLYRSSDSGTTNTVVSQGPIEGTPISAIGISPQNDNVRIVGLANGDVWRTTTGSSTLVDVTGGWKAKYAARTVVDPNNANIAYVALDGFMGGTTSGDSHVWRTTNLSNASPTWTAINTSLPDVPVNAFVVDPADSTDLFAGTDIGVFRSTDSGAHWFVFGTELPRVAVFDMAVASDGSGGETLRAATHGKGMWQIPISAGAAGFTLTVHKDGTGTGTVNSDDGHISCGNTCSFNYASATDVILTATPSTGASFIGWTNCDAPSGNTCTMHAGTANKTVTATFNDVTAPHVTMTAPAKAFQTKGTIHVAWTATDSGGSGVDNFDVFFKFATPNTSTFTSYTAVANAQGITATSINVAINSGAGAPGDTFCFAVKGRDNANNVSGLKIKPKCTEMPIDDKSFGTHPGFTQKTGQSGYYHQTVSVATAKGSNIAGGGIHAKHLAVLVTKCNGCGTIQVLFGGTAVGNPISLQNSTTVKQVLVLLPAFSSVKIGTVEIKVTSSGKRVEVDGVGTSLV